MHPDHVPAPPQSPDRRNPASYEDLLARVREAWADVLAAGSVEEIPLNANFLEVGGNSLLLVMLWEELQPLSERPLKLSELFQHGSVQAQAELLMPRSEAATPATLDASRSLLALRRAAAAEGRAA
jgi:hypothetical protein